MRKRRRTITFKRRTVFAAVLLVVLLLFTEAASLCGLWWTDGLPLAGQQTIRADLAGAVETPTGRLAPEHQALHPYLGFVADPHLVPGVNELGFPDTGDIGLQRSRDSLIVGVLGGSVAEQFCTDKSDSLKQILQQHLPHRDVRLVCMAQSGYKQPQQLMTLAYFLAQGAQFDVVINIDGFNEVALPLMETAKSNRGTHTHYAYPYYWHYRVADILDSKLVPVVARIRTTRESRQAWARMFSRAGVRHSPTANLVWLCRDRRLSRQLTADRWTVLQHKTQHPRYSETGPVRQFQSEDELLRNIAELWQRCSLQLANLCRANQIRYYHFLQPNLYVAGSKPMGEEERRSTALAQDTRAVADELFVYRAAVEKGYPLLVRAGQELVKHGVSFHDLTMIYSQVREPIYSDGCCHYNTLGNELLGKAIAQKIMPEIQR